MSNQPVKINKGHLTTAGEVYADAFQDDPFISYVFPDLDERKSKSPKYWKIMIHYAFLYGEVYATSNKLEGVVAWLPSAMNDFSLIRTIRSGGLKLPWLIGSSAFKRLNQCVGWVLDRQKKVAPQQHIYLNALCVAPDHQGKGFSNLLLKSMFDRLDKENLPCYMETQKSHILPFYERLGFEVADKEQIPGTGLTNWAMIRNPKS